MTDLKRTIHCVALVFFVIFNAYFSENNSEKIYNLMLAISGYYIGSRE